MASDMNSVDVVIVGGGLVGASLACALAPLAWQVALVEAAPPPAGPGDARKLALAEASLHTLSAIGVLRHLRQSPTPIRHIQVSREGDFGGVDLHASTVGRELLGGVVLAGDLQAAFALRLQELGTLRWLRPARAVATTLCGEHRELTLADGTVLRTRLLAAADGADSPLRSALGIAAPVHHYDQHLFVSTLHTQRPPQATAYERFTAQGPCALLPMADGFGAVCGVSSADAARVAGLDDSGYIDYFQARFGWRAGRVQRVGPRSHWPLRRVLAERLHAPRAVVLGNAAQTLHPVGAQGFNLGLRDAMALAARLADTADPGSTDCLSGYAEDRQHDRARTIAFTDGLARVTAAESLIHRVGRSLGFAALNLDASLRGRLALGAMGNRGSLPGIVGTSV